MSWLRISIVSASHDPELISELFSAAGALSITFEDAADQPILEPLPGETSLWSHTLVSGLFTDGVDASHIVGDIRRTLGDPNLQTTTTPVEDQDWERSWMDQFQPLQFGRRLWICPKWHTPPQPDDVNIMLDPGLAFGTGTHPTTALCLEWLDSNDLNGKTMIDYGCGSGILAIAAAKLGAHQVYAVDHDPQALNATTNNAIANLVDDRISISVPEALPELTVDVLLANILAGPLLDLAPRFARLVQKGGTLVLSGILNEQTSILMEKYHTWFNMEPATTREEWVRLNGQRNNSPVECST